MIGVIRRIFDGMLLCIDLKGIINEVFVIFMVKVFLIVNLRFLVVVLIDFDDLFVLIFNILFIQKMDSSMLLKVLLDMDFKEVY